MSQLSEAPEGSSDASPVIPKIIPAAAAAAGSDSDSDSSSSTSSSSTSSSSASSDSSASLPGQRIKKKKKKAPASKNRRAAIVSDSDSFEEASQPAAKRPARRSAKKGASGATKKRKKVVHEEAIEDNAPEEELERGARKKNRNRVEVSDDEKQAYVKKLIDDMMRAAENDHAAYRAGRPALFKEEMLERVRADLLKSDLHEILLTGYNTDEDGKVGYGPSILDAIAAWLRPVDKRSLPLLRLRTTLFQLLEQLPAELDHIKGSSGIGSLLMEFRERVDETLENKRVLERIIRRWTRMIMGKADSYRRRDPSDGMGADMDGELPEPRQAPMARNPSLESTSSRNSVQQVTSKSLSALIAEADDSEEEEAAPTGAPKPPVFAGIHARVPESVVFNFTKSPVQPTLVVKQKAKVVDTSGFGQLEKRLKDARRKKAS